MRMWMIDPKIMCRQHLLGEHVECHMLYGLIVAGRYRQTEKRARILCPQRVHFRHKQLADEMTRLGYNHNSPMDPFPLDYKPDFGKISVSDSLRELLYRCPRCRSNYEKIYGAISYLPPIYI